MKNAAQRAATRPDAMRRWLGSLAIPFGLAICVAASAAQAAPTYHLTVIPSGYPVWPGPRINDAGMVAGAAHVPGDPWRATYRSFRWTLQGGLVFSPAIDRNSSTQTVNLDEQGRVASTWFKPNWPDRVFRWDGVSNTAALLGKGRLFTGNSRGDLLGYTPVDGGWRNPRVIWTFDGEVIVLPLIGDEDLIGMNDKRQLVGATYNAFGGSERFNRATIWSPGEERLRIQPPPGYDPDDCYAAGINDAGEVVGWALGLTGGSAPFYWSKATGSVAIPTSETSYYYHLAIAADGSIVGGSSRAWIWNRQKGFAWLDSLIDPADPHYAAVQRGDIELDIADDVNAHGQIVVAGNKRRQGGVTIMLTPVTPQ